MLMIGFLGGSEPDKTDDPTVCGFVACDTEHN